ncbi:hypothetical protein SUGI_0427500 [Cryptomeria japonica]|nr:hypothetical protein SUGI_0427500 [Cryptomeria japonica]
MTFPRNRLESRQSCTSCTKGSFISSRMVQKAVRIAGPAWGTLGMGRYKGCHKICPLIDFALVLMSLFTTMPIDIASLQGTDVFLYA